MLKPSAALIVLGLCANLHGSSIGSSSGGTVVSTQGHRIRRLFRRIRDINSSVAPSKSSTLLRSRAEFQALAAENLGEGYDPAKVAQVSVIQGQMREKQVDLVARLQSGLLTSEAYADAFRALLSETASRCEAILGPRDFAQLFGIPASAAVDLGQRRPASH